MKCRRALQGHRGSSYKQSGLRKIMEWLRHRLKYCSGEGVYLLIVCVFPAETLLLAFLPKSQTKDPSWQRRTYSVNVKCCPSAGAAVQNMSLGTDLNPGIYKALDLHKIQHNNESHGGGLRPKSNPALISMGMSPWISYLILGLSFPIHKAKMTVPMA